MHETKQTLQVSLEFRNFDVTDIQTFQIYALLL